MRGCQRAAGVENCNCQRRIFEVVESPFRQPTRGPPRPPHPSRAAGPPFGCAPFAQLLSCPYNQRNPPAAGVLDKLLYEQIRGAYEDLPPAHTVTMTDTQTTPEEHDTAQGGRLAPYEYQWRAFADWCGYEPGRLPMPVPPSLVARYLADRAAAGASHSTLRVIAAAIARRHTDAGQPNPCGGPVVESVLAHSERSAPPVAPRSRPLDLEAYRSIRKTAQLPRPGRGRWQEGRWSAQDRGRMDLAMIGLMRDGMLRVREASDLTWGALESLPDGTGRLRTGGGEDVTVRVLSVDTMRLLNVIRHDAGDSERIIGLMPNQITLRIGAVAEHAGLGPGYSGESPRLGMLKDLDDLGAVLLGERLGRDGL